MPNVGKGDRLGIDLAQPQEMRGINMTGPNHLNKSPNLPHLLANVKMSMGPNF